MARITNHFDISSSSVLRDRLRGGRRSHSNTVSVLDTSRASTGSVSYRVPSPTPPHPSVADPAAQPDKSRAEPSPRCHVRQRLNSAAYTAPHAPAGRADVDRASPNCPIAACRSRGSSLASCRRNPACSHAHRWCRIRVICRRYRARRVVNSGADIPSWCPTCSSTARGT
jgi:hypothetical protein